MVLFGKLKGKYPGPEHKSGVGMGSSGKKGQIDLLCRTLALHFCSVRITALGITLQTFASDTLAI